MARRECFIPRCNVGYTEGCWLLDRDVNATGVTLTPRRGQSRIFEPVGAGLGVAYTNVGSEAEFTPYPPSRTEGGLILMVTLIGTFRVRRLCP